MDVGGVAGDGQDVGPGARQQKVFVAWTVYKSRAAMAVRFIRPDWAPLPGGTGNAYAVSR